MLAKAVTGSRHLLERRQPREHRAGEEHHVGEIREGLVRMDPIEDQYTGGRDSEPLFGARGDACRSPREQFDRLRLGHERRCAAKPRLRHREAYPGCETRERVRSHGAGADHRDLCQRADYQRMVDLGQWDCDGLSDVIVEPPRARRRSRLSWAVSIRSMHARDAPAQFRDLRNEKGRGAGRIRRLGQRRQEPGDWPVPGLRPWARCQAPITPARRASV